MAVYEYSCEKCGRVQSISTAIGEATVTLICCGVEMRRNYNFGGVTFKGSGFYRTDR